jgi:outer membrane protein OmpA-like peptidoglycan-associated protein
MRKSFSLLMAMMMFLFLGTSCARYHFGVPDQAIAYPPQFDETEEVVAKAEQSPGAKYCPEKIAKAKELGKQGVLTWWRCDQPTAWKLFADARQLAKEAEGCQAAPPPPAPKPAPAPPPPAPPPPPPPPKPAPAPAPPPAPKVIDKLTLQVLFDVDKSTITEAGQKELQKAVAFVKKYPGAKIEVGGHTDSTGTDAYNQKLSERRATAVKDYLIKEAGVESSKITAVGYGEAKPVADNKTAAGRAQNRRVEISILSD